MIHQDIRIRNILKTPASQKITKKSLSNLYEFYEKPYHFFGDYLRNIYGLRIFKLPINANLSCPNRKNGVGCIFCSEDGSASPSIGSSDDIHKQMVSALRAFKRSGVKTKYIAYFQAYTNTYASPKQLKRIYDCALQFPDIIGLMIGTRPDCLSLEVIDLIASYKKPGFELWVELGMQTAHNKSLNFLNRGHTHQDTIDAVGMLHSRNIPTALHIILGIPGESWNDMMETAAIINKLPIQGVKFHHLHVLRNTPLYTMYQQGGLSLLSFSHYVSIFCDFVERLRKEIVIHRIAGNAPEELLIAPAWGHEKGSVEQGIIAEFHRRGSWQGLLT